MIDWTLICLLIIVTPFVAILDYYAFRNKMDKPIKWFYFLPACVIEIGMFTIGYLFGSVL